MKRLFVLILVLLSLVIGCGNTDPSGGNVDENIPMPEDSPVYKDIPSIEGIDAPAMKKVDEALNEGVRQLGNLNGYAQYFAKFAEGGSVRKVYIKDGNVKLSGVVIADGKEWLQYVVEYSLGQEIATGFTLNLYSKEDSFIELVTSNDYTDYKMYKIKIIYSKTKEISATDWTNIDRAGDEYLRLIKITDSQYCETSKGTIEKDSLDTGNYKLYLPVEIISDHNFSHAVVTADKF